MAQKNKTGLLSPPIGNSGSLPHKFQDPRWRMRWFLLVTFTLILFAFTLAGIFLAYRMNNPGPLVLPTPLLLAMRPIIRYLFR